MQYNFLDNSFTTYENVETPKVQLSIPLMDDPLDISDWAEGVSSSGIPIVKNNLNKGPKMINDNPDKVDVIPYSESTSQSSTTKQSSSKNLKDNQKIAYNFFVGKGLQPHQAAGLVGNLIRESQLDPTAVNKHSGATGIAQWLGDRKKKLFAKYGKNPTFNQQLDFIWEELNSTHKKGLEMLKQSLNVDEAAANAFGWYEFSVGPKKAIQEMKKYGQDGVKSYNQGIKYARTLLE